MYEQTGSPLDMIGKSRVTSVVTAALTAVTPFLCDVPKSYAAETENSKQPAPLEERLKAAPKQQPPVLGSYKPTVPGPFTVQDINIEKVAVQGAYDEKNRKYTGTIRLGHEQYTLTVLVDMKEDGKHYAALQDTKGDFTHPREFDQGGIFCVNWESNVSVAVFGGKTPFYLVVEYASDEKVTKDSPQFITKIENVSIVMADKAPKVPDSVREREVAGLVLPHPAIACEPADAAKPDAIVKSCESVPQMESNELWQMSIKQSATFCKNVRGEIEKMLDAGTNPQEVLDYKIRMRAELERRLNLDSDITLNLSKDYDPTALGSLVDIDGKTAEKGPQRLGIENYDPDLARFFDEELLDLIAKNQPEEVKETPAPEKPAVSAGNAGKPADVYKPSGPVAAGGKDDATPQVPYVPGPGNVPPPVNIPPPVNVPPPVPVPHTPDVHKTADVYEPVDVAGPVALRPPVDVHPALDLTQQPQFQKLDEEDRWYNKWWVWTLVGAAATGLAVGLGVGLTQGHGGGSTQPPVGTPTMNQWDNHDPAN
ncbi:hypothetical protein JW898_00730 [Candidatus Woesearchaeota archaeon]|nr:hypothetical protein [Candidatus Woesearchaeota archaeon]